ncbi:hypothetical protein N9R79_10670 [Vibrio sp.]|nr:hypothetical protein [Vibrio sp.]
MINKQKMTSSKRALLILAVSLFASIFCLSLTSSPASTSMHIELQPVLNDHSMAELNNQSFDFSQICELGDNESVLLPSNIDLLTVAILIFACLLYLLVLSERVPTFQYPSEHIRPKLRLHANYCVFNE